MEWLRRIWYLLNRRRLEREMEREMAWHREMMGEMMCGRRFGSELRLREDAREVWGWTWLDRLWQDLSCGARVLRKSPGFTVTAVLVLSVGIGVTLTAVRVLLTELRPPGIPNPETLVHLTRRSPAGHDTTVAYPMLEFYRARAKSFQSVMGRVDSTAMAGDAAEASAQTGVSFVTANYFLEMGMRAAYGRLLDPATDEAPGAEPVALLSRQLWERRWGGDPAAIGSTIRLNGKPLRIAGIVISPRENNVWVPLVKQPYVVEGSTLLSDWSGGVQAHARLRPGVSPQASEQETKALAASLREERPKDIMPGEWLDAKPADRLDFENAAAAAIAATLVLLVLVVACTNLGILLLARGAAREREVRIRMALGAGRRRVVRQLFTESLLLASLGSLCALLLSSTAMHMLETRFSRAEPVPAHVDWRVAAATMTIGLIAAVSFGLAPALRLTSGAPRAGRARTVFLTLQVAASCVLLMLSGLLVRSFERLIATDPGFDYRRIAVIQPGLSDHGYRDAAALTYLRNLRERVLAIPGVERASVVWLAPWGNVYSQTSRGGYRMSLNHVDAEFLETLRVRLVRGRNFEPGERDAAIVSESVARWQWPGEDPLGKRLKVGNGTVIGVVRSAGTFNLRTEDTLGAYFPLAAGDAPGSSLVVRVAGRPEDYVGRFRAAARGLDERLQPNVHSLHSQYDEAIGDSLRLAETVGGLGTLATLLAAIGLAGLTGYTVSQRTREIGVRMALGARGMQVVRAVLAPMARPVAMGFAGGMLGAAAIASALHKEIFGLRVLDPLAYGLAVALFLAVMALAAWAPARRAMRVNPSEALRHE